MACGVGVGMIVAWPLDLNIRSVRLHRVYTPK